LILSLGTISSSGVVEAIYDYWKYYEPIRVFGPPACITATQKLTQVVDEILIGKKGSRMVHTLKSAFGLGDLTYDNDFANIISYGISGWQSRNWGPEVNDPSFMEYCDNITSSALLYPETASLKSVVKHLIGDGHGAESAILTTQMLNYIGYVNVTQVVCFKFF
jgi:hypothetical protein